MNIFTTILIQKIKLNGIYDKSNMESGIYKIKNNINGLVYIGSTINLNKRWYHFIYKIVKRLRWEWLDDCSFRD